MDRATRRYRITLQDRRLACARLRSPETEEVLCAMRPRPGSDWAIDTHLGRYLPRQEPVEPLDRWPRRPVVVIGGEPDVDKAPAALEPLAA